MCGLGSIGQRHLRNLKRLLGDELEVVAWRARRRGHVLTDQMTIAEGLDLEEHFGIRVVPTLEDGLAEQPDAVFVTNPSSMHLDVATRAAQAGCNLFVEKPLSHTLDGVDELIALVEKKGLVAAVGYQMRFHPCIRLLRSLLADGPVGPPVCARHDQGEYMPGWHPYEDFRELFAARRDQAGGVLLSQVHELDTVCWLYGMARRVYALGGHWSTLEVDVEDVVSLLLECRYGERPLAVHVQQDFLRHPPVRTYEVVANRGVITADLVANEVRVFDGDAATAEVHRFEGFQRNDTFVEEMQDFLGALRGEHPPAVDLREGTWSLRLALAAHRSIASGQAVEP